MGITRTSSIRNERGATLAVMAVLFLGILAVLAICIDLAMIFVAHNEAQRVVDSAALAGASAFIDYDPPETAVTPAEERAVEYATKNFIRNALVEADEVTVEVILDERKVRVWVNRADLPTWFARLFGVDAVDVGAMAAAVASDGGEVDDCTLPFFGPDLWEESNDDNQIPESGEEEIWEWNEGEDNYDPKQPADADGYSGTGYGSGLRNGILNEDIGQAYDFDYGRKLIISTGSQGNNQGNMALGSMLAPGNFQLWRMPLPGEDGTCDPNNPEYASGGDDIRTIISGENCGCPLNLSEEYEFDPEPGQTWGPVKQGLDARQALDPNAWWDEESRSIQDSELGDDSPLIVTIALADPSVVFDLSGSSVPVQFNNFAKVFIGPDVQGGTPYDASTKSVYARFLGFVSGGGGEPTGSLIKYLRLVE